MPEILTELANKYGSDKGNEHISKHHYTRVYDALLGVARNAGIKMLEIGLLNPYDSRWNETVDGKASKKTRLDAAPSLLMWSEYFGNAEVHGADIEDFSAVDIPGCTIHRIDQGNRKDLLSVAAHGPFDVIIDDASHASTHQQLGLACLFPALKPGGLYFIEDLHWQPQELEDPLVPKTQDLLQRFAMTGKLVSPLLRGNEAKDIEETCEAVAFFDSLAPGEPVRFRDALCVMRKRREPAVAR
jgi:hypothetical protein